MIICFHNPSEENGYLSNWYLSNFVFEGKKFSSLEQYMMYQKAILFKDEEIAKEIMNANDVAIIKELGRKVHNYDDKRWDEVRGDIVYNGLLAKFSQNEELKKRLLGTGDAILAECALHDKIWGIGISMRDQDRFDQSKWKGESLLGKNLMKVRETLRNNQ